MIAFTSQLPHVLACAYVLSPSCPNHNGFSAGSYRDVSRVANINAGLWAELFLENREPLVTRSRMRTRNACMPCSSRVIRSSRLWENNLLYWEGL